MTNENPPGLDRGARGLCNGSEVRAVRSYHNPNSAQAYSAIPEEMQEAKRWLLQRNKRPFYVDGSPRQGPLDGPEDVARLGTFAEALAALQSGDYSGLGFALGPDGPGYWQGIDLDNIEANGLNELAEELPGYVEWSPSGGGVHAIGYGEPFAALTPQKGVEAYSAGRFFTVTGWAVAL